MINKLTLVSFMIFMVLGSSACARFHGMVIDADTRQPIEGAVVVASWIEERGTATGGTQRLKDVKEALTDKNGEWSIRGQRGTKNTFLVNTYTFFTFIIPGTYYTNPPDFIVFKPGYCSWPNGFNIEACKGMIKPGSQDKVADGEIVELPGLTSREDKLKNSSIWPSLMESDRESLKKVKNLLRLLNQEDQGLGLPRDPRLKEIENE